MILVFAICEISKKSSEVHPYLYVMRTAKVAQRDLRRSRETGMRDCRDLEAEGGPNACLYVYVRGAGGEGVVVGSIVEPSIEVDQDWD